MSFPKLPNEYKEKLPTSELHSLKGHDGAVFSARFNSSGTYCLTGGKDRTVRLWNPHSGLLLKTYTGHGYEVRDVSASADNSKFASVGGDKQVFLWDVASGNFLRKFRGHDSVINSVVFAAGDSLLVSGGYDQYIKVWDCRSRSIDPVQAVKAAKDSITSVCVSGSDIVAGSVDGTVRRLDVRLGRAYCDELHAAVTCVRMTGDRLCVLAALCASEVVLLDKAAGEVLAQYTGHKHESVKMECALMPGDEHVIGCSETGEVLFWELVDAQLAARLPAHPGHTINSLAVHPAGDILLTAGTEGLVRVWGRAST